jgi:hypothetical protein
MPNTSQLGTMLRVSMHLRPSLPQWQGPPLPTVGSGSITMVPNLASTSNGSYSLHHRIIGTPFLTSNVERLPHNASNTYGGGTNLASTTHGAYTWHRGSRLFLHWRWTYRIYPDHCALMMSMQFWDVNPLCTTKKICVDLTCLGGDTNPCKHGI